VKPAGRVQRIDGSSVDAAVLRNIESPPRVVNGRAVLPGPEAEAAHGLEQ
jgi:hypothetical protein